MDDGHDFGVGLAHRKANGLNVGDKIDVAPPKVRAILETLPAIERDHDQAAPSPLAAFKSAATCSSEHAFALRFVFQ